MNIRSAFLIAASCLVPWSAVDAGPAPLRPAGQPSSGLLDCVSPTGGRVTVDDADNCATTGIRISWPANPTNWGDSGAGVRSYDLIRNADGRKLTFPYMTTSYLETPPQSGHDYSYTLVYRNGCGLTRNVSDGGGDYDFTAPPAPPPTNQFPTDGGSQCRSPHPTLDWSAPIPGARGDVLVDGQIVCAEAPAPCFVPPLTEGWHTWQVITRNVCHVPTEGPVWSFRVGAADETCDGYDNDCDGEIDEELTRACDTGCASGTQPCALGQWLSCSARPCCDMTVGPDLPESTLCPAAETASSTVCLLPGTYSVPVGCNVRASIIGTGDPAATIIEGDLTMKTGPARIQGLTISGRLESERPLEILESRVLGGVGINNPEEGRFGTTILQVAHNEVHGGLSSSFSSYVHANDITGGLGLGSDSSSLQAAVGNHTGGVHVGASVVAYLAGNLIEGIGTGISIDCRNLGAQIVGNRVSANATGISACIELGDGFTLLRNDIVYGGENGVKIQSDVVRIEGNQIVRAAGASPTQESTGIFANILGPDQCPACPGSLRDNTIVGGTVGVRVVHQLNARPAVIAGNIVVGSADTGVFVCERSTCPASPPLPIEAVSNNVFSTPTLWAGLDDPTGANGNISADPRFLNPANGDYRLGPDSPCVDAEATGFLSIDLAGSPRALDGDGDGVSVPDMGAWEAPTPSCQDEDGDGFGSPGAASCAAGGENDCNDANSAIHPDGIDLPGNSVDENCDGSAGACDPDRAEGWRNHGQFVRCVAHEVGAMVESGLISPEVGKRVISDAARSGVGR